jgi:hypothetical protein
MQMNDLTSDGKEKSCCGSEDAAATCCQPAAGNPSSCCFPGEVSWKKGKMLVSAIIILAAIGVGANTFFSGSPAQSYTTVPVKSFSAGLTETQTVTSENSIQDKLQTKKEEISLNQVLDSLQSLDTVATDKDVVFLVLPGEAQISSPGIPKQLGTVANNLWISGRRVAVFKLNSGSPDHNQLVRHFSIKTFPSVVILGRQGQASAVAGDITEAGLYNAYVLASTAASCCPTQGNASGCPPQSNASCCPK